MYVIPIVVLAVVIAVSAVWTDQKATAPSGEPASGEGDAAGGIWGEKKA